MPNRPQNLHSIYGDNFPILHFQEVNRLFLDWRNQDVYLVARLKNGDKYVCWKGSKRGNSIYVKNINRKFRRYINLAKSHKGRALFITFTNQYPYGYTWKTISHAYNKVLTQIRAKYKDYIGSIRFFESFKNGFPHIHAILFFKKTHHIHVRWLFSKWRYYVKIRRVYSVAGLLKYCHKSYLLKDLVSESGSKTTVMCWYFRKRQYAISKMLRIYLFQDKRISKLFQINLFGERILEEYVLIGIYTLEEVEVFLNCLPSSAKIKIYRS